jgi:hypothetical protein
MTPRERRRSFTITDSSLTSSGTNRNSKNGSRHVVGGKKDGEKREACEAKARNKNSEIRE